MLKTKYLHLLVLLPININRMESTREKVVETNLGENRKQGIASIKNIGMQLFSRATERYQWCSNINIFIKLGCCN